MKRFVNAKLLDQVFDVGALKVNQLWRMREAVSNVFNEAKIVPMLLRNKLKAICYIYPRVETGKRASLEQSFDHGVVNHEVPDIRGEVVLGKAASQDDGRPIRFPMISRDESLVIIQIQRLSLHR